MAVATYPFLSGEWIDEARRIREQHRGATPPAPLSARINLRITDVPFGTGEVEAHVDTTSGEIELDLDLLDKPDATVIADYATAKAMFVDQNPQVLMQAFMAGKVVIQGDMTKLLGLQQLQPDPAALDIAKGLKDITAP